MIKKLILRYEWLILIGLTIAILSLSNVLGYTSLDSNIFWSVAGIGLAIEGILELYFDEEESEDIWTHRKDNPPVIHDLSKQPEEELLDKKAEQWHSPNETRWGDDH